MYRKPGKGEGGRRQNKATICRVTTQRESTRQAACGQGARNTRLCSEFHLAYSVDLIKQARSPKSSTHYSRRTRLIKIMYLGYPAGTKRAGKGSLPAAVYSAL